MDGFLVTERIDGAHPNHAHYPLLPGDLLTREAAGTWAKEAPGLMVIGFTLTDEQAATLEPRRFHRHGLGYCVAPDDSTREEQVEAAEDHAEQVAFDAHRERS